MAAERSGTDIHANVLAVRERIAVAARAAGRDPAEVTLVAVSKTQPAAVVAGAIAAGVEVLGENRVQEAEAKIPAVGRMVAPQLAGSRSPGPRPCWHLIGHLQTNKAKAAVGLFHMIESVDGVHLAEVLDRRAREAGAPCAVLLQVNVAGEETKGGFAPDELRRATVALARLDGLSFGGLMTVAPLAVAPGQLRDIFGSLRLLFGELAGAFPAPAWRHLSMGMSNDFEHAIAEGATLVRIGRAIFGERG